MNNAIKATRLAVAASAVALTLGASPLAHAQDPLPATRAPVTEPAPASAGLPVQYVERPLTLPEMTLAPEFGASLTHLEFSAFGGSFAANLINLNAGASFGIIDDLTAYVVPLVMTIGTASGADPDIAYGTFRLGAIYRFLKTEVADIGAQLEFGATGSIDLIHLTGKLPILLRLGDIVRLDTGVALSGFFPVNGGNAIGGLAGVSSSPTQAGVATAGLPVDVAFQVAEPVFLGINTGLGIANFEKAGDSLFSPLGAFVGGTVASEDKALLDIKGTFSFPYFLIGSDPEPPLTNAWTVGLDARAYIDLGS